jgi:CBS domain-containing protein
MDEVRPTVARLLREVRLLRPQESVREAEEALAEARVTALPVVDEGGLLLGTVSQKELDGARSEPASARQTGELVTDVDTYADLERAPATARGTRVSEVMNTRPVTVGPDADMAEAAALMSELGVHELPVVRDGVVVGILSALDVLEQVAGAGA